MTDDAAQPLIDVQLDEVARRRTGRSASWQHAVAEREWRLLDGQAECATDT